MRELLTPRQVARAVGVSEASLKRWCDKGLLPSLRTAGGHRRLPINGVIQFLRDSGHPVVRPELLGLPRSAGVSEAAIERSADRLGGALEEGDEEQCRRIVADLYLAGHTAVDICDQTIAAAFHALGSKWQHGQIEVYQERRGCVIGLRLLYELRAMLATQPEDAPYAIGGTLEHDPYSLPTAMIEVALREAGWRAESHGAGNPAATLCAAIEQRRPRLFWLSVSTLDTAAGFLADYRSLYETAARSDTAMAVGGSALTRDLRQEMTYSAYCDNLRHLITFAETIHPSRPTARRPERTA